MKISKSSWEMMIIVSILYNSQFIYIIINFKISNNSNCLYLWFIAFNCLESEVKETFETSYVQPNQISANDLSITKQQFYFVFD